MAVVIRFKRTGSKGRPFYRIVVADSRYPRDGRFIQQLGYYNPLTDPATFKVDEESFAKWMRTGATQRGASSMGSSNAYLTMSQQWMRGSIRWRRHLPRPIRMRCVA